MQATDSLACSRLRRYSPGIEPRRLRRAESRCSNSRPQGPRLEFPAWPEPPRSASRRFKLSKLLFCGTCSSLADRVLCTRMADQRTYLAALLCSTTKSEMFASPPHITICATPVNLHRAVGFRNCPTREDHVGNICRDLPRVLRLQNPRISRRSSLPGLRGSCRATPGDKLLRPSSEIRRDG